MNNKRSKRWAVAAVVVWALAILVAAVAVAGEFNKAQDPGLTPGQAEITVEAYLYPTPTASVKRMPKPGADPGGDSYKDPNRRLAQDKDGVPPDMTPGPDTGATHTQKTLGAGGELEPEIASEALRPRLAVVGVTGDSGVIQQDTPCGHRRPGPWEIVACRGRRIPPRPR
jgi:hypothetical protein